jgi:phytoene dehydrogenase-like protein
VIGPSIDDVERAMDAVKYGRVSEDPVLEATIPSLTDPSLAPEGKH